MSATTPDPPPSHVPAGTRADVELVVVTIELDALPDAASTVESVLAKYIVVSRGHPGCRNIDLCASVTVPDRFVVLEKWESAAAQQAHFDSPDMVEMASACRDLLARPPRIDLLDPISAHDLA